MSSARGFTLLEIMVVIVLLGVISSLVVGTIPRGSDKLRTEHEHLLETVSFTVKRARLESRVYGIVIDEHQWRVVVLAKNQIEEQNSDLLPGYSWQQVDNGHRSLMRKLPTEIRLTFSHQQEGIAPLSAGKTGGEEPQLLLLPGGEATPGVLSLYDTTTDMLDEIEIGPNGKVSNKTSAPASSEEEAE